MSNKVKDACSFDSHLTPKEKERVAQLVGKRCNIKGRIDGKETTVLWDTGSQVALIGRDWLKKEFEGKDVKIRPLEELLGRSITVEAAGGMKIPYDGYAQLKFECGSQEIMVPFLVTKEIIQTPIIGFNVISMLMQCEKGNNKAEKTMREMMGSEVDESTIVALMKVLNTSQAEELSAVKVRKNGTLVKAGDTQVVSCKIEPINVDKHTAVLFEPQCDELLPEGIEVAPMILKLKKGCNTKISVTVMNHSNTEKLIPGRLYIGDLKQVSSVTPVDVTYKEKKQEVDELDEKYKDVQVTSVTTNESNDINGPQEDNDNDDNEDKDTQYREMINGKLDLSMLTDQQQRQARKLFWKERHVFAVDSDDIGCATELKMNLPTKDDIPVQKNYNSIPIPLIDEVKQHVEDLLNRQWITKSRSAWSSPVVLVRKKDGKLRLCCDFRKLNRSRFLINTHSQEYSRHWTVLVEANSSQCLIRQERIIKASLLKMIVTRLHLLHHGVCISGSGFHLVS